MAVSPGQFSYIKKTVKNVHQATCLVTAKLLLEIDVAVFHMSSTRQHKCSSEQVKPQINVQVLLFVFCFYNVPGEIRNMLILPFLLLRFALHCSIHSKHACSEWACYRFNTQRKEYS